MKKSDIETIKNSAEYKPIFNILMDKYDSQIPTEVENYVIELAVKSDHKIKNIVNWIGKAKLTTDRIISETNDESELPLFWVFIHEIVFAFYESENQFRDINEIVDFKLPIMESLDKIRNSLTKEDLTFIKYMRHSHVHIFLDYIWSTAKIKDDTIISIKGPYDSEAIAIANSILEKYDNNQILATIDFAKKISDGLAKLFKAVNSAI